MQAIDGVRGSLDDLQAILERVADSGDDWARELVPRAMGRLERAWSNGSIQPTAGLAVRLSDELHRRVARIDAIRDRQSAMREATAALGALAALRVLLRSA